MSTQPWPKTLTDLSKPYSVSILDKVNDRSIISTLMKGLNAQRYKISNKDLYDIHESMGQGRETQ